MKRLVPLAVPPAYIDRYITIRDRKKHTTRGQLVGIHPHVVAQYMAYSAAAALNALHVLRPDPNCAAASPSLLACFDSPTANLNQLLQDIKAAQPPRLLKYCPMCGTTLPQTVDHYAPVVSFPEFAVHPLNLVPCCSKCNSTKHDDWLSVRGARYYLHAFSDPIPTEQFLFAMPHFDAAIVGVGVTFELRRPPNFAQPVWDTIESHFDRLHLIERYNELSNDEIEEQLASCRSHLNAGGGDARAFLANNVQDLRAAHGVNHWRVVLMDSLSNMDALERLL